jgi:RimJ/RimL family protein N-acetyltransferase
MGFLDIIHERNYTGRIQKKEANCMLETQRLLLRPFREADAQDLYAYRREPLVNCFHSMMLSSPEDALAEIRKGKRENCFAIVLKETGRVIGEIEAHPESSLPDFVEAPIDTYSPCWMLHKDFHGQGYAYEAAFALFDWLFREQGARRIYAYTEDYNLPSQHLCEKLGMRREGLFLEFVSFVQNPDGTPQYENTMQYAILKREWLSRNGQ